MMFASGRQCLAGLGLEFLAAESDRLALEHARAGGEERQCLSKDADWAEDSVR
jgi:hypothetical protein